MGVKAHPRRRKLGAIDIDGGRFREGSGVYTYGCLSLCLYVCVKRVLISWNMADSFALKTPRAWGI